MTPIPRIGHDDDFDATANKLAAYITTTIKHPAPYDALRTTHSKSLDPLCRHLAQNVHFRHLITVLLGLKGHFTALDQEDIEGLNETRGLVCEHIALRYSAHLSERELIDVLLLDTPGSDTNRHLANAQATVLSTETVPLLAHDGRSNHARGLSWAADLDGGSEQPRDELSSDDEMSLLAQVRGLNALEVAAVTGAKKFLSERSIQRIITAIWDGDIIFWSTLSNSAIKHAQMYRKRSADPFARLRVPKYLKAFEVVFFAGFLGLYYAVLVQRSFQHITVAELLLYVWLASFAYNEFAEYWDAGTAFYLSDFWTMWDVGIVCIGAAFLGCRIVGLTREDQGIADVSFDILAMEALFLVPRIFSLLSLHPYFGTLLPCLRDMTKDFVKFLSLVVILYLGFLTTFSLLARDQFSFRTMSWILIKVFFGSSYLGFDVAEKISPILGPPLMLIFVCLTNILLITSLISILSNSLTKIIEHAAEEYKFVYSVFVLEASTSNRLTYFVPPLNLIPLALRPLRLVMSNESLRTVRIGLLKFTHMPHVATIQLYERCRTMIWGEEKALPLVTASTPRRKRASQRYSRIGRMAAPQALTNGELSNDLTHEGGNGSVGEPISEGGPSLQQMLEAIKSLEQTVAQLSGQVTELSSGRNRTSD